MKNKNLEKIKCACACGCGEEIYRFDRNGIERKYKVGHVAKGVKRSKDTLDKKPRRICYSVHECCVCHTAILCGQEYYDGGYGRRAHVKCIN
jgi:hypothetical protein